MKPQRNATILSSDRPCRDCGRAMVDTTKNGLKSSRCRECYNDWYRSWTLRRAAEGKHTGARARLNAAPAKVWLTVMRALHHASLNIHE